MPFSQQVSRRAVLYGVAATTVAALPTAAGPPLRPTPRQTEGPFYPDRFPEDVDSDLLRVAGHADPALGEPLALSGRVLDTGGRPIPEAVVEIWQADANGRYLHSADWSVFRSRDLGFQGYGRATTGADGGYRFRTIRPVAYGSRTPHVHFAIRPRGGTPLITQMYVAGEAGNARDFLLKSVRSAEDRALLVVPLDADAGSGAGPGARWRGVFDIVLG